MPDYIFTDDLADETLGALPRYWTIQPPPYATGNFRTTFYLRVAVREEEKVVEARIPKLYTQGYARGPDFEQIWYLSARLCGLSSLSPFPGLPNLGVGEWAGDHVRLGLCVQGGLMFVTAQGRLCGEAFKQFLLQVPLETREYLHTYAVRLIPTMEFYFDGQLVGTNPQGA